MAAGVPTTGIGGIYYILLTIGLLFYKLAKKIACVFEKQLYPSPDKRNRMRKFFPPIALAVGVSSLVFMNVTGFRFSVPGTATATLSIDYLWVIGAFSVAAALVSIFLVNFRSRRTIRKAK